MTAEEKIEPIDGPVQYDAFKEEFQNALIDLMDKVRFRGTPHYEWIADQIAQRVSEDPRLQQQLLDALRECSEREQMSA